MACTCDGQGLYGISFQNVTRDFGSLEDGLSGIKDAEEAGRLLAGGGEEGEGGKGERGCRCAGPQLGARLQTGVKATDERDREHRGNYIVDAPCVLFRLYPPCLPQVLDTNGDGVIDWTEFLMMTSALENGTMHPTVTEFIFKVYDRNGDGWVDKSDLFHFFAASLMVEVDNNIREVTSNFVEQVWRCMEMYG